MIGIIILNYNTWDESIRCIESIRDHLTFPYRIYLVDNCSTTPATEDQMKAILSREEIFFLQSEKNRGYAAGNNIGLKMAYEDRCDQFLICNSDILFVDDTIEKMSCFAQKDRKIAVVGPMIYTPTGEFQPIHMLSKLTAFGKIQYMMIKTPLKRLVRKFEKEFIRREPVTEPIKVFGVSGCCFLITKNGYEAVFPFDEHTFLYEEEYILGCRLETSGMEAWEIPGTYIIHAHGASTGGMTPFSYQCLIDSEQYYLKEYAHSSRFVCWVLLMIRKAGWHVRTKIKNQL